MARNITRTRAYLAGRLLAKAIIEIIHLMYQNGTALRFLGGLTTGLNREHERRMKAKRIKE